MSAFFGFQQLMARFPFLQRVRIIFWFFDSAVLLFLRKPEKTPGQRKKVIIFFTHSLGDCAMFLSASGIVRELYPEDKFDVTLSCKSLYADLFRSSFPNLLPVDYIKTSVSPLYRIRFLREMRKEWFDIAIDPFGMEECYPSLFAMNAVCAEEKIGLLFRQKKRIQTPAWLRNRVFTRTVFVGRDNMHKNALFAAFFSGLSGRSFLPCRQEIPFSRTLLLPERYCVVFPSASIPAKRWDVVRFVEVTKRLYKAYGLTVVCVGTENDREPTEMFLSFLEGLVPYRTFLGKTTIMQVAEILGRAELVVTNDTGIFHLAIGTGTRTCVVSGGYSYSEFLDYSGNVYGKELEDRVKVCAHKYHCMDCGNDCRFRFRDCFPCIDKVSVDEVWEACSGLLGPAEGKSIALMEECI